MKITIVGIGYVGLVNAACLADLGNEVFCIDKDHNKIRHLQKGMVPFYEPNLQELVNKNMEAGRLKFTTDMKEAVKLAETIFLAVGTPAKKSGEADASAVIAVAKQVAAAIKTASPHLRVIVNKSTVPVGMGEIVTGILLTKGVKKGKLAVVSNPEFLREGSAIEDFMNPDRIVIGADDNRAFNIIKRLYRPLNAQIIFTSIKGAELIKYASNAFLATKISFINEIANICDRVGLDVNEIAGAIGLDKRIGKHFLKSGLGFGGSCLPKDISALIHLACENRYKPQLLAAVKNVNYRQIDAFLGKIIRCFRNVRGRRITVLGVSFKPETDDLREAPALKIINKLKKLGAIVSAYDPALGGKRIYGFNLATDVYSAMKGADALIVATEWDEFRRIDFKKMKKLMKQPVIFDGRNIYDPCKIKKLGFKYFGVGR